MVIPQKKKLKKFSILAALSSSCFWFAWQTAWATPIKIKILTTSTLKTSTTSQPSNLSPSPPSSSSTPTPLSNLLYTINSSSSSKTLHKKSITTQTKKHPSTASYHPNNLYASPLSISDISSIAKPLTESQLYNLREFKLQPRFNLWGFTGDRTQTEGQFLAPLYGDQTRALYALLEGNYAKNDSSWLGGAGFGYRQVVNGHIYGGYALADYVSTPHNGFTFVNPGVEMLGKKWDINVNGYIPLDNKKKLGKEGWAGDDFGDYSHVINTGHYVYDYRLQQYEEPARGADFEIGRVIPYFEDAKLYLGGYHFDTSDSGSVNGIETRLTYDLNKYSAIELENNYDNIRHNQFIFGIRLNLGNYSKEEKKRYGISTRLLDPIEHDHIVAGNISSVLTHKTTIAQQGGGGGDDDEQPEHDNVWYFEPGTEPTASNAQEGDGTAENPFIGMTYDNYHAIDPNIGVIDPHPLLYFTPGSYSLSSLSSRGIDNRFNLPNGWGMYGRASGYAAPATGDDRALFPGGLDMYYEAGEGTEATTLNSVRVVNTAGTTEWGDCSNAALYATNADNVILQNVDIENSYTNPSGDACACGIYTNSSTINFTSGTNTITASTTNSDNSNSFGIFANSSTINFTGGTNTITASATNNASSTSESIYADTTTINFTSGTNTLEASTADSESTSGFGIDGTDMTINFTGGTNTISANANSVWGIYADSSSIINFDNPLDQKVTFQVSGATAYAIRGAGATTYIKRNGETLPSGTTLADMQEYINFEHSGGSGGKAVYGFTPSLNISWP